MSQITCHILDTSLGKPATDVNIQLFQQTDDDWQLLASARTNHDGRVGDLLASEHGLASGCYRIRFDTEAYFTSAQRDSFYPYVDVVFKLAAGEHYHIPLLLSAFGYSTYRGS